MDMGDHFWQVKGYYSTNNAHIESYDQKQIFSMLNALEPSDVQNQF